MGSDAVSMSGVGCFQDVFFPYIHSESKFDKDKEEKMVLELFILNIFFCYNMSNIDPDRIKQPKNDTNTFL